MPVTSPSSVRYSTSCWPRRNALTRTDTTTPRPAGLGMNRPVETPSLSRAAPPMTCHGSTPTEPSDHARRHHNAGWRFATDGSLAEPYWMLLPPP